MTVTCGSACTFRANTCAVLLQFGLTWDRFPIAYREHPVLTVDTFCLGVEAIIADDVTVPCTADDVQTSGSAPAEAEVEAQFSTASSALDASAVRKAASGFRDVLGKLVNLSYLVQSTDVLKQGTHDAEMIHNAYLVACPHSHGLLLESASSSTKANNLKRRLRTKPKRKDKKSNRVSREAAKVRLTNTTAVLEPAVDNKPRKGMFLSA